MKKDYARTFKQLEKCIKKKGALTKFFKDELETKLTRILEGIVKSDKIPKVLRDPFNARVSLDDNGKICSDLMYLRGWEISLHTDTLLNTIFKKEIYSKLGIPEQYVCPISYSCDAPSVLDI